MELGSEFEFSTTYAQSGDTIFEYLDEFNTVFTASGRSALRALVGQANFKVALLPEYICESVIECFDGIDVIYYAINPNMSIDFSDLVNKINSYNVDCLYIMHYFGKLQDEEVLKNIQKLKSNKKFTVLEDTTHSIFTSPITIGDYCICSLRKWFAIPDGGVLYSRYEIPEMNLLESDSDLIGKKLHAMILKRLYLADLSPECNPEYRNMFIDFDVELDSNLKQEKMSSLSTGLLKAISISNEIESRKENYKYVIDNLNDDIFPVMDMKDCCPLVLPIYVENRDAFRTYLIEHNIFCAVHWPINIEGARNAKAISTKIISLPIDSRYSKKQLGYLIETINGYEEKK